MSTIEEVGKAMMFSAIEKKYYSMLKVYNHDEIIQLAPLLVSRYKFNATTLANFLEIRTHERNAKREKYGAIFRKERPAPLRRKLTDEYLTEILHEKYGYEGNHEKELSEDNYIQYVNFSCKDAPIPGDFRLESSSMEDIKEDIKRLHEKINDITRSPSDQIIAPPAANLNGADYIVNYVNGKRIAIERPDSEITWLPAKLNNDN